MTDSDTRAEYHRRIPVGSLALYGIVSNPHGQVAIDGTGLLKSTDSSDASLSLGDTFVLRMDRTPLGEPSGEEWVVDNKVVVGSPGREFAYEPAGIDGNPSGHRYGYLFDRVDDRTTDVTLYVDWSATPGLDQGYVHPPVIPEGMLEKTLERLESVSTS